MVPTPNIMMIVRLRRTSCDLSVYVYIQLNKCIMNLLVFVYILIARLLGSPLTIIWCGLHSADTLQPLRPYRMPGRCRYRGLASLKVHTGPEPKRRVR